jgi:hypothetical protein
VDDEGTVPIGAFVLENDGAGLTATAAPREAEDE